MDNVRKNPFRGGHRWRNVYIFVLCLIFSTILWRAYKTTSEMQAIQISLLSTQSSLLNPKHNVLLVNLTERVFQNDRPSYPLTRYTPPDVPLGSIQYECVPLATTAGSTTVCVFSQQDEESVSSQIKKHGRLQQDWLTGLARVLRESTDTMLLDVGCGIGALPMYAAALGARVVAIDPSDRNLQLLSESVRRQGLQDRVFLFWNSVSSLHEDVRIVNGPVNNVASYDIVAAEGASQDGPGSSYKVKAVTLDDMAWLFDGQTVIVRMDVKGYGRVALESSKEFFQKANVRSVIVTHHSSEDLVGIESSLNKLGFFPFSDEKGYHSISDIDHSHLPLDITYQMKSTSS